MKAAQPTYRILLAEDDIDDQYLIKMGLKHVDMNVEVNVALNGANLLDRLKSERPYPDLIMLDINMPRMDGKEVLKHIKSDASYALIPVVMYTTSEKDEDIEDAYRLGANSYIVKPLSFNEVTRTLKALCHYWFEVVKPANKPWQ